MIQFDNSDANFFAALKLEVNQVIAQNSQYKKQIIYKAVVFLILFLAAYINLFLWVSKSMLILNYIILGTIVILGGINFGHDGIHKTLSKHSCINTLGSLWYVLVGLSPYCWSITHNVIHHNNSNIINHDHDIMGGGLIDFTGKSKKSIINRYQYLIAPLLYSLVTFHWLFYKDIKFLGLDRVVNLNLPRVTISDYLQVISQKLFHLLIFLLIPLSLMESTQTVILGFVFFHITMGLIFSHLALVAHVNKEVLILEEEFFKDNKTDWYTHQLLTTANFIVKNKIINYFLGGLPNQIEHHLFPYLNHMQIEIIYPLVRSKLQKHGKQYIAFDGILNAVKSHYSLLYKHSTP